MSFCDYIHSWFAGMYVFTIIYVPSNIIMNILSHAEATTDQQEMYDL
jgi:hypothetical protein